MPQVLKDEIREKITASARKLFISKGYENVSMNEIAREAGIAVGNIYRYFKGKGQLYKYLAEPVALKLMQLFQKPLVSHTKEEIDGKVIGFLEIYESEKELLFILLESSHNTDFYNLKEDIINGFADAISRWTSTIPEEKKGKFDEVFIKAYASAYVNGIISILSAGRDDMFIKMKLYQFSTFMKDSLYKEYAG